MCWTLITLHLIRIHSNVPETQLMKINRTVNHIISITTDMHLERDIRLILSLQTMITPTSPIEGHWLTHTHIAGLYHSLLLIWSLWHMCHTHASAKPHKLISAGVLLWKRDFLINVTRFKSVQHAPGMERNGKRGLSAERDVAGDRQAREMNTLTHTCSETGHITSPRPRNAAAPYVSCTTF